MTYFSKIIQLNEFKYNNWAYQAWMNTKQQTKKEYWTHRIVSELSYLKEVSVYHQNKYNDLIEQVSKTLYETYRENGAITKSTVLKAESDLEVARDDAKKYEIAFAAHAHIDINWLWGYHETVQVTIDTFQTMLDIMKENEDFIYSQSQAALYQIIEEYHPLMFEEIKERVAQGRWEVTASTWVEGDKNLSNGESQARQIMYAKNYLKAAFGISHDDLVIDFEPDTFGHVETIPEILNQGKVKYYYHVRGTNEASVYRFKSPSTQEIIVYRDAKVYTMGVSGHFAKNIVAFCHKHQLNKVLAVYGVSDHGGGPTRKDIEMIHDMMTWPIFPTVNFTTYKQYYQYLEENKNLLPVVDHELNVIFSGCYTSQSRIKMANRYGENGLYDAELVNAISKINHNTAYSSVKFADAWKKILLNQFHDILPGSGITYTREYALGKFQEVMAYVLTSKKLSLEAISKNIDTSHFTNELENYYDTSNGAGVGFNSEAFKISKVSRGRGNTRIYHLWNTLPYNRREQVEIFVWNYEDDIEKIKFIDSNGNVLPFEATLNPKVIFGGSMKENEQDNYWGHWYQTFLVEVDIPALGYETIILMQDDKLENKFNNYLITEDDIPHIEHENHYVMENDFVKVTFDPQTLRIKSYYDKENNEELMRSNGAGFSFVIEDASNKMDSWVVGRTKEQLMITDISDVKLKHGLLTDRLSYQAKVMTSELVIHITLSKNSKLLTYHVNVEWKELGRHQYEVKKLAYHFPINKKIDDYFYDVAFGVTKRKPKDQDVSGLSFGYAQYDNGGIIATTDSKYGFRGYDNELQIALIRSTTDPDLYPEVDSHQFKFQVGAIHKATNGDMIKIAKQFNHPIDVVMGEVRSGNLPLQHSYATITPQNIVLSSIKLSETENHLIIRLYEVDGKDTHFSLALQHEIEAAYYTDLLETELDKLSINGDTLNVEIKAYSIVTLKVKVK